MCCTIKVLVKHLANGPTEFRDIPVEQHIRDYYSRYLMHLTLDIHTSDAIDQVEMHLNVITWEPGFSLRRSVSRSLFEAHASEYVSAIIQKAALIEYQSSRYDNLYLPEDLCEVNYDSQD